MDLLAWSSFSAAALLALAVVLYLYRRRETAVRGRWVLAGLRWLGLALLILLAFDPDVPEAGLVIGADETHVLLDASLSMALPAATDDSATRWTRAAEEARGLSARGGDVILFGDESPGVLPADSLGAAAPSAATSRLLPALRAASEAGARRAVVVTDGGIEDADAVARAASSLGIALEVRTVGGGEPANLALAEVAAPGWAEAGEAFDVRIGVVGRGEVGDSVDVALEHDGRPLAATRVEAPGPGRVATATLRVTPEAPSEEGGLVRYETVIDVDDAADDDDRRSVYVHVSDRPSGVVLLSFRPDWEQRFLQPTLERSLGMPVEGFLHVAPERYLGTGAGEDAGRAVDEAEVRRAADAAEMIVLHGLDAETPAWARDLAMSAPRVLVFPGQDADELELPIPLPARGAGEWYPVGDVPPSPVASLLAALEVADLPPLTGVRAASPDGSHWSPIDLRRGRSGPRAPLLLAGEDGARRWAVALADGYWRWAFRGGDAERVYRRLWSAVGGWLVEDRRDATIAAIRPADRVVARGAPVRWLAPGLEADSVAVEVEADGSGSEQAQRHVVRTRADTAVTPTLAPGHYRYRATAYADGESVAEADGPFTVASYARDFTRRRVAMDDVAPAAEREDPELAGAGGRPLHSTPWPYVALLAILCAEWALRRRWGLR